MATSACRGSGSAAPSALLLLLVCALWCCTASAATWTVGDSKGWIEKLNYSTWTAGKTFVVGDMLFFPYTAGTHDVAVVDESDYNSCTTTNAKQTYTDGNTNVTLSAGSHYYLCTFSTHCANEMKLAVTVVASGISIGSNSSGSSNHSSSAPSILSRQLGCYAAVGSVLLSSFLL